MLSDVENDKVIPINQDEEAGIMKQALNISLTKRSKPINWYKIYGMKF
jgi:hypothetical protein